jgi:hypothetical protein
MIYRAGQRLRELAILHSDDRDSRFSRWGGGDCELIGRPLGSAGFVAAIEKRLGRALALDTRGRKPRNQAAAADQ